MPYDSLAIANYFIERAADALNPMKAQKLVYFAHGWNLAINDQPLITERIQAWRFGPVAPQLYHDLKIFGADPIPAPVETVRFRGARPVRFVPTIDDDGDNSSNTRELLDKVWEVYGRYSAVTLSNATHVDGSPWDITWKKSGGAKNAVIDDDLIKQDFKKKLDKANPAPAV